MTEMLAIFAEPIYEYQNSGMDISLVCLASHRNVIFAFTLCRHHIYNM